MIEWLKIRSYRTFWVLLILFVVCTAGVNYTVYQVKVTTNIPGGATALLGNPFAFPDVWQTVTYISSFLLFLPGLIVLILTTNEYSFKTHRQNIIDGVSRFDFAFAKILIALKLSGFATLVTALIAVFVGLLGNTAFSFDGAIYLLYFLLQAITYSLFGLLLGFLIKRSGLAIALYFIYLFFVKNILSALANHFVANTSGDYFPIKSSDSLIPLPVFQSITKQMFTPPNVTALIVCTLAYLAIFYFIIIKKFTKEDL